MFLQKKKKKKNWCCCIKTGENEKAGQKILDLASIPTLHIIPGFFSPSLFNPPKYNPRLT